MNREDIIRMAREAGLHAPEGRTYILSPSIDPDDDLSEYLERFATLVAEHEREACAQIADRLPRIFRETQQAHYRHSPEPFNPERFFDLAELRQAEKITQSIRARDKHD